MGFMSRKRALDELDAAFLQSFYDRLKTYHIDEYGRFVDRERYLDSLQKIEVSRLDQFEQVKEIHEIVREI